MEIISVTGAKNGSIPTTNTLTVVVKGYGNDIGSVDVDWYGDSSHVTTFSINNGGTLTFKHVYDDYDLYNYYDDSVEYSRRNITLTTTAYNHDRIKKSSMHSHSFTIYNYREWMNSTITAPVVVEDGVELGVYVSLDGDVNIDPKETNLVYRLQGEQTWSNKVPFSRADGKEYYFHLPDTTGLNNSYEYKVQTTSNSEFSVPATDNWSDIKTVTFQESFAGSLDFHTMDVELYGEERTYFQYLTYENAQKFLRTNIKVEILKAVINNTTNIDVDLLEYEVQLAVSQLNLGETEAREVTSLVIDLLPYVGTAKSGSQLLLGRDILTDEEINRYFEGLALSADAVSFGAGGRVIKFVKHSDKVSKFAGYLPKVVHNIKMNRVKAVSVPYKYFAKWGGVDYYRNGGYMTAIEHILYRHSYGKVFEKPVSNFSKNTSVNDIYKYVDDAMRYGIKNTDGNIIYDTGKIIGTDRYGYITSKITILIDNNNVIRSSHPIH